MDLTPPAAHTSGPGSTTAPAVGGLDVETDLGGRLSFVVRQTFDPADPTLVVTAVPQGGDVDAAVTLPLDTATATRLHEWIGAHLDLAAIAAGR